MDSAKKQENAVDLSNRMHLFQQGAPDVFAKADQFVEANMLRSANIYPYYQLIDSNEGPTAFIDGKEVIMLGSNNYLGLTIHPEVRKAAIDAIEKFGTSLTGSRLLNGTHQLHVKLEEELADYFGKESCLVFTTGYQANLGVVSALILEGTTLIMDKADHASIYDASKLGKGAVKGYKHNDMVDLERVLNEIPADSGKLIMIDGVFSMEGDIAVLPQIIELAKKYKARVAVDDAHGVGILGEGGRGTAHHFGVQDDVDLIVGTFSKTLASIGGFVLGPEKVIDFLRHFGRSVLFSASPPPASVAAVRAALQVMKREPERVTRVVENGNYFREGLKAHGFNVATSETPIVPIVVGNEILTLQLWRELLESGVYVNAVLYPATPRDRALLRTSCTSEHTKDQLDKAIDIFVALKKKHQF